MLGIDFCDFCLIFFVNDASALTFADFVLLFCHTSQRTQPRAGHVLPLGRLLATLCHYGRADGGELGVVLVVGCLVIYMYTHTHTHTHTPYIYIYIVG